MTNQTKAQQPQAVGIAYLAPLSPSESAQGQIVFVHETDAHLIDCQKVVAAPFWHLQPPREWFSCLKGRQPPTSTYSTNIAGIDSKIPCWFISNSKKPIVNNHKPRGKIFWKTMPHKKLRQLASEKKLENYGVMIKKEDFETLIENNPNDVPKFYRNLMRQNALAELPKAKTVKVSLWSHVWELRARIYPGLRAIIDKLGTKTFLLIRLLKDVFTSMSSAALIVRLFFFEIDNLNIQWLLWGIITALILIFFSFPKTINYFKLTREMQKNRQIVNGLSLTDFWRNTTINFFKFKRTLKPKVPIQN